VVAVVVTHDAPEERFDDVLQAFAAQDYPNLDVMVVATGAVDPTERVHAVLPDAPVHLLDDNPGFGSAANVVLDRVSGAEFFVFAHDDVVPDRGAVTALVAAADEWDAGVVGPKLVDWRDPRRLAQFGATVDRLGVMLPIVERGELDQGQHDGLRDVFAVPGGCTLVRASLFERIGGFDESISFQNDDLSLCWRARVAGAKVLVTSGARVRHAEAYAERPRAGDAARLGARHRVRVVLTSYRLWTLLLIVPQAWALTLAEAMGALATGRFERARAAVGAWPWNFAHLPSLVAARREVARLRAVPDRDVRRYQVRGLVGPRLRLLRVGAGGRATGRLASQRVDKVPVRGRMDVDPAAWSPGTALVAVTLAGVIALGSRHLVTQFVPAIGELVPAGGGTGDLLGAWAGGWRSVGLGADAATPGVAGMFGALGALTFGHLGLVRTLLTVGLIPVGVVGAHRLLAPAGSKRAQVAAAVAYAAVPLPYDALATGRWAALAAYAGAPWMLGRLARASGVLPFGPPVDPHDDAIVPEGVADDAVVHHRLWKHVVVTGAVTAAAGLLVPQAPLLVALAGVGLVAGSLLVGEARGTVRVLAAALGGAVVSAVLLFPTTLDVVASRTAVEAWLGADRDAVGLPAADLLTLHTGPADLSPALYALLGAAAMPVLIGRRWRLGWAARGWAVAAAAWAVVWVGEQGWLDMARPDPGVVLAVAATGLAMAAGLGLATIEHDVRGRSWRFGLRRLVAGAGVAALAGATIATVVASTDGWWNMPRDDYAGVLRFADEQVRDQPSRVLWVGDDELIPGGSGWRLDDDLAYTAGTTRAVPDLTDLWPATQGGASPRLGAVLERAVERETARLGRELAPYAVQFVVVPRGLAPSDMVAHDAAADAAAADLLAALAEQLDLQQVRDDRGLTVYRNTAFRPLRAAAVGGGDPAWRVLDEGVSDRRAEGPVPDDVTVVQASTASDHWALVVDGRAVPHDVADGWADAYTVDTGGEAALGYRTPLAVRLLRAVQVLLWVAVAALAMRMRFGPGDRPGRHGLRRPRRPEHVERPGGPDGTDGAGEPDADARDEEGARVRVGAAADAPDEEGAPVGVGAAADAPDEAVAPMGVGAAHAVDGTVRADNAADGVRSESGPRNDAADGMVRAGAAREAVRSDTALRAGATDEPAAPVRAGAAHAAGGAVRAGSTDGADEAVGALRAGAADTGSGDSDGDESPDPTAPGRTPEPTTASARSVVVRPSAPGQRARRPDATNQPSSRSRAVGGPGRRIGPAWWRTGVRGPRTRP
jgi:GT2 family glycosyltransferase